MEYERLTDEKFVKAVENCNMACVYGENCIECVYFKVDDCAETTQGKLKKAILRLAELEDKIEQGTLIELPCKVGDTVYFIIKSGNEFVLLEDTCIGFTIADGEIHIGLENIPVAVNKYYFTREEAEKALENV